MDLDRIDYKILSELQNNIRIANKELAATVGLAPSTCHERVKKLWETEILLGARALVCPKAFGIGIEAMLFVQLAKHKRDNVDIVLKKVSEIPEVRSAFLITGRHDLVVHIVARDTAHLRYLAHDCITSQPGVVRMETSIIYEKTQASQLPNLNS